MTTTNEEQQKPKRRILWGKAITGAAGCIFAIGCALIDGGQNALYAMQEHWLAIGICVGAAVGLVIFSHDEGEKDWTTKLLVAACGAVTIFCGVQQHRANQRNLALHEQAVTTAYNKAQDAIAALDAEQKQFQARADAIAEQLGTKALAELVETKKKVVGDECKVRGPRCRKAEEDLEAYQKREGDAKAKEAAQARADEAWGKLQAEKEKAPAQAKADLSSPEAEWAKAIIYLLVTVLGATRWHWGWSRLQAGWNNFEQPKPVKKPAPAKKPEPEQPKEEKKSDLQRAVEACFEVIDNEAEEWMSPEKALGRINTYYDQHYPKKAKPTPTALGTAMGKRGANFPKGKVNGQQRYGVRFTKLAKVA